MRIAQSVIEAIGNTPLIYLKKASEITGCTILGKAEFMNPGGSVKDRAAKGMLQQAFAEGLLGKGGQIIEATAGNTGIGLALVGNQLGLKTHILINNDQANEKKQMLTNVGVRLIEVEPKPYSDPDNYIHKAQRLAEQIAKTNPEGGVLWVNQFDNCANRESHLSTANEIWQDCDGGVDGFVCAVGTGGTLAGVAQYLRAKKSDIVIGLADPFGAKLYSYYQTGVLASEGSSITEGIGQGRVTGNLVGLYVDLPYQISDQIALEWVFHMLQYEGLALGMSSGINIAGAVAMAKDLGKDKIIVTMLCDGASRYQTKLFNAEFLQKNNLPILNWDF